MKKSIGFFLFVFLFLYLPVEAQDLDASLTNRDSSTLHGSLRVPGGDEAKPVVLIIAGSGPTDRNGNNPQMINNAYRMLADSLEEAGIASLRYDKRGIAGSAEAMQKESGLRFEDYVYDAAEWIEWLKKDERFSRVIVLGHSEGSLIGMIAARYALADAFISCAGPGRPADQVIREQLQNQPLIAKASNEILDILLEGRTVDSIPPLLNALFRPSVQPYLISWLKYDPAAELSQWKRPALIIQGTTDIQVSEEDARLLKEALPPAELVFIEGMNHILKPSPKDYLANISTYSKPDLGLHSRLPAVLIPFIKSKR